MEKSINERGYALLIVLLLIVFITIITAVFLRGSISNAKQEQRVDENNLRVTAAEAGVEYYQTKLSNAYYSSIPEMKKEYEKLLAAEQTRIKKQGYGTINYNDIKSKVFDILQADLETTANAFTDKVQLPNGYTFRTDITDKSIIHSPERITVKGMVVGFADQEERVLSLKQTFPFPDFSAPPPSDNTTSSKVEIHKPDVDFHKLGAPFSTFTNCDLDGKKIYYNKGNKDDPKMPSYGETCKTTTYVNEIVNTRVSSGRIFHQDKIKLDNSIVYHGDGAQIKELELEKAHLYINGGIDIYEKSSSDDGSLDLEDYSRLIGRGSLTVRDDTELQRSDLFFQGDIRIDGDLDMQHNSFFYQASSIDKDALTIFGEIDIQDSKLLLETSLDAISQKRDDDEEIDIQGSQVYIYKNLTSNGEIELQGSRLTVLGNFKADELELKNNSRVCVGGDFTVNGGKDEIDIQDNSKVFLLPSSSGTNYKKLIKDGKIVIVNSEAELIASCGVAEQSESPIEWPDPLVDVIYIKR